MMLTTVLTFFLITLATVSFKPSKSVSVALAGADECICGEVIKIRLNNSSPRIFALIC